jgi:hypothetical protein
LGTVPLYVVIFVWHFGPHQSCQMLMTKGELSLAYSRLQNFTVAGFSLPKIIGHGLIWRRRKIIS